MLAPTKNQEVCALLERHGLRAKKRWGQNFLVDDRVYRAIVDAAAAGPGDVVVEIGAGLGTLTRSLLLTGATVIAVERERDMCAVLKAELGSLPRFHLSEENALTLDVSALAGEFAAPALTVAGNLPYHIATPLLFRLLEFRALIPRLVLMFQREVGERLLAAPGDDDWSALSAQVQMLAQVRRVCLAGRGAFLPAPKVESLVVLIEPRPEPLVPVRDLRGYAQVVRAAFGQRRKTLRNALAAVYGPRASDVLARAGIDPSRRGETLRIDELAALADLLEVDADPVPFQP